MNYPVWDLGFAHGLLIATVAVLHVFVSHFAVGGGLFLVLTETWARRRKDTALLDWLHGHARFFILLTLVFGAISGVGIWFTIGLLNPAGTSALIHAFVWGWAIEWVLFFVEIAAALVYYYGWDRMAARPHLTVGWIYFAAAWLSMVVINGILSFQLTPGAWIETRSFWDGFLNPTYFSSLVTRTAFAGTLAGLFTLATASRLRDEGARHRLIRYAGWWSLAGLTVAAAGWRWWWSAVPEAIRELAAGTLSTATLVAGWVPVLTLLLAALVVAGPLLAPRLVRLPVAALLLAAALGLMGSGEWLREAVRKPWIVRDYLYGNGMTAAEVAVFREDGLLAHAKWVGVDSTAPPEKLGEGIFRVACMNCHARDGYNGLAGVARGWDADFASGVVQRIETLRKPMPPWIGTEEEAAAAGTYLARLGRHEKPLAAPTGEAVFASRCGICHTVDGVRALREMVEGMSAEEIEEMLPDLESDEMPAFTGSEAEARALAAWLAQIGGASEAGRS